MISLLLAVLAAGSPCSGEEGSCSADALGLLQLKRTLEAKPSCRARCPEQCDDEMLCHDQCEDIMTEACKVCAEEAGCSDCLKCYMEEEELLQLYDSHTEKTTDSELGMLETAASADTDARRRRRRRRRAKDEKLTKLEEKSDALKTSVEEVSEILQGIEKDVDEIKNRPVVAPPQPTPRPTPRPTPAPTPAPWSTGTCPSTHPYAYRPRMNFDYCCAHPCDWRGRDDINAGPRAQRSDNCEGHEYKKCSNPPCQDAPNAGVFVEEGVALSHVDGAALANVTHLAALDEGQATTSDTSSDQRQGGAAY